MSNVKRGVINKFNRGEVDPAAFARDDVEKIHNSCELMENFLPQRLGPMQYRMGSKYLFASPDISYLVPFVSATDDANMLEFSPLSTRFKIRVIDDDIPVSNSSCTTVVQDPSMTGTGGHWIDADETADCVSTVTAGAMSLTGSFTAAAKRYQTLTTETGVPNTIIITITRGENANIQIGTNGADSSDIYGGLHKVGTVILTFTPDSAVTITISNSGPEVKIENINTTSGEIQLTPDSMNVVDHLPFDTYEHWGKLRWAQSADKIYFCAEGFPPFVVTKLGPKSWAIERYWNYFGPYGQVNVTDVTMDPDVGGAAKVTLTFNKSILDALDNDYTGVIYKYVSSGQDVTVAATTDDDATDPIFVFGTGLARTFGIVVIITSGTYAIIRLEKSFDSITWQKISDFTTGISFTSSLTDGLDGAEIYYRLRVEDDGGAPFVGDMILTYDYGSIEGEARVINSTADTYQEAQWYKQPGRLDATRDWYVGSWGGKNPYPTAVGFYEGRLWFAGNNKIWGSVTDNYTSFDRNLDGASASIERTIGFGPVDNVLWLAPSTRLMAGLASAEINIRSSTFGEVLTDLNTNLKSSTNYGVAPIRPIVIDDEIVFVQRGQNKIISLSYSINSDAHAGVDLNTLNPTILDQRVVRMEMVRNPETRIYAVLGDGSIAVLMRDPAEDALAWSRITTADSGSYKDICVLPAIDEDKIYLVVERTDGTYIEKFASLKDCIGANRSDHFDSFVYYNSPGATSVSVAHLASLATVRVWADGEDRGDFTVTAGNITLTSAWTDVTIGLTFEADYTSNKLMGYDDITVLGTRKRIVNTGLIMRNVVAGAVKIGPSIAGLDNMPGLEDGVAPVSGDYDYYPFEFDGISETDPRIYIRATGPCTIMALGYDVKNSEHKTRREK